LAEILKGVENKRIEEAKSIQDDLLTSIQKSMKPEDQEIVVCIIPSYIDPLLLLLLAI
jgi:hypothetical protein